LFLICIATICILWHYSCFSRKDINSKDSSIQNPPYVLKRHLTTCGRKRGTGRRGHALPEVIQEDSNREGKVTIHEAGPNPGGPKLLPREAHGSC